MRHPDNACAASFPFVGGVALLTPTAEIQPPTIFFLNNGEQVLPKDYLRP
ncbi:hypothetical protein CIP100275_00681 [Corynebacterium diphtheriae]|nr:hypothetical protein CIP107506_00625 [Corynebacterium diphtheriae]CAB0498590.1 hypothetical protein CIP100275_00681 [Corynebacterium diphtheriae]CAB0539680.1 hypothetical protein CIP107508_00514 [Corynebacterium diphtheriae]CAB0721307.1 hypothetical protein FRC0089_00510 [Corynebacterium diphtheriae]CAB0781780.1 hypothetical protein FRC0184_00625 [Corynebacterium diphtheriae]